VQADTARQLAVDEARRLNSEVWALKGEVARLHNLMRRLDISEADSLADAEAAAAMFTRLKLEAEAIVAEKRAAAAANPHSPSSKGAAAPISPSKTLPPKSPMGPPLPGSPPRRAWPCEAASEGENGAGEGGCDDSDVESFSTEQPPQLPTSPHPGMMPADGSDMDPPMDDAAFESLQNDYMRMQYDELFSRLEAREGHPSLLLVRGNWLREMTGGEFALPEVGAVLPPEATILAADLRTIFGRPSASSGGYRQVALPFLTVTHFWTHIHPDPEEEVLRAVLDVLQQKWEDFADRDLGLYLELSPPQPADTPPDPANIDAVLWLVTCKMRTVEVAPEAVAAAAPLGDSTLLGESRGSGASPRSFAPAPSPSAAPAEASLKGQADSHDGGSPPPEPPASARSSTSLGPGSSSGSSQGGPEEAL